MVKRNRGFTLAFVLAIAATCSMPANAGKYGPAPPPLGPHGSLGTIRLYTCGPDPSNTASYANVSNGLYISTHVGNFCETNGCNAAGGDWEGLNNVEFQSVSVDYQNPPTCVDQEFTIVLEGTDRTGKPINAGSEFFNCPNFSSAVDLHNGFTRYTINQGATSAETLTTPAKLTGIILLQYTPFPYTNETNVFGNVTLNGTSHPAKNTTPIACPPNTFETPELCNPGTCP